jgi:hypothetical protein
MCPGVVMPSEVYKLAIFCQNRFFNIPLVTRTVAIDEKEPVPIVEIDVI